MGVMVKWEYSIDFEGGIPSEFVEPRELAVRQPLSDCKKEDLTGEIVININKQNKTEIGRIESVCTGIKKGKVWVRWWWSERKSCRKSISKLFHLKPVVLKTRALGAELL